MSGQRKKKSLPENEDTVEAYESKEFLAVDFSYKQEKTNLITLTGEPDFQVLFWDYPKCEIMAKISIGSNFQAN